MGDTMPSDQSNMKKGRVKKTRSRRLPPNVAARNLAIEKQRREALNDTFLELARLVPALAPARRISKVLIVKESIQHIRDQRTMCLAAAEDMEDLLAENQRLVSELNTLRSQVGGPGVPLLHPRPVTEAMVQLKGVKDQVFGTFPAGFGDNWTFESPETQPASDKHNPDDDSGTRLASNNDFGSPEQQYHVHTSPQSGLSMPSSEMSQMIVAEDGYLPQGSQLGYYGAAVVQEQRAYDPQPMIPPMDHQPQALPAAYSQIPIPTAPPFAHYLPAETLEATSINPLQYNELDAFNAMNWSTMNSIYDNNNEATRF